MDATVPVPAEAPTRTPRAYLLDTHGLVFQMFHGMPQMNAPDGRPTNAVFGVTRALLDLYEQGAEYLIATFDTADKTFRDELYGEYKAHRPPMPDDLRLQEPMIDQVLEGMRIPVLRKPGYEADDIIATVSTAAAAKGMEVFLCTSDKDCRQLLGPKVKIQNLRKGVILDEAGVLADWGVRPDQTIDFQALVGDSVDNVPGVAGCGAKTAAKWLQEFGTLDKIVENSDYVGTPKLRESLKKAIANGDLERSRKLVRLETNVPMTLDWEGWRRKEWDGPKLLALFEEFGFRGFAARVKTAMGKIAKKPVHTPNSSAIASDAGSLATSTTMKPVKGKAKQFDLFGQLGETEMEEGTEPQVEPDHWKGNYYLIDDSAKFDLFLESLKMQARFAIDLETTGLDPISAEVVGYAISWKAEEAYYLPVRGPEKDAKLDPAATLAALKPILENPSVGKVNQNIKYDQLVLRSAGVNLVGVVGDPMVAHYLLNAGDRSHGLDEMTFKIFRHTNITIEELIGKRKQLRMDQVPTTKVAAYAGEDADAAWRLAEHLEPMLVEKGLKKLYDELEIPLLDALAELEYQGVLLDLPFLKQLSSEMTEQLMQIEADIHRLAGKEFRIASLQQLQTVLYDELKLPILKRTGIKGEPSTDHEVLEKLAAMGHALPKRLLDYRAVTKLQGTYVDALPALVNAKTGRLHTSFNQTVATTGRLSSSDPNLQNIPMRTDQGREIRKAFIAPPGWQILTADYSQIELRLLAHFCEDEPLMKAFADDQDIHALVAAQVFQTPLEAVTKQQRGAAKAVNFGVIYGISAVGLSMQLGIPKGEAAKFIDEYFARYPKVLKYQDSVIAKARTEGFVSTILGRRREFNPASVRAKSSYRQRNQAEREAINMEIQGSAADLMKLAMLNIHRKMKAGSGQAKMLLTVHDELVFEAPPGEIPGLAKMVREEMVHAMALRVPLKVDVSVGSNWLEVEDIT